jgi:hypothetical protein
MAVVYAGLLLQFRWEAAVCAGQKMDKEVPLFELRLRSELWVLPIF